MKKSVYFLISYFLTFLISLPVAVASEKAENVSTAEESKGYVDHSISRGETMHMLAAYYLNDPRMWKKIYFANQGVIKNPNKLVVGTKINIPLPDSWRPVLPFEEFKKVASSKKRLQRDRGLQVISNRKIESFP